MFQKIRDMYHYFRWKMQPVSCYCSVDEQLYNIHATRTRKYIEDSKNYLKDSGFGHLFTYPPQLVAFEDRIYKWLDSIPKTGHPEWEKMWTEWFRDLDEKIRNSKTKEEVESYESLKISYSIRKKHMEELHEEHLAELARKCHCPKHRYMKNSG